MNKAVLVMAMEENKPVIICNLLTHSNIARIAKGKLVGAPIS